MQSRNALHPISVTDSGIVILLSEVQFLNASSPIFITEFGITVILQPLIKVFVVVLMMALHPSRESYTGLPSATTILSSKLQPLKVSTYNSMTDLGIVILVSEVQSEKASFPISSTLSGITTLCNSLHPENALCLIVIVPSGIMATPSLISNCAIVVCYFF